MTGLRKYTVRYYLLCRFLLYSACIKVHVLSFTIIAFEHFTQIMMILMITEYMLHEKCVYGKATVLLIQKKIIIGVMEDGGGMSIIIIQTQPLIHFLSIQL